MNAERLLAHFDRIADAPDAIPVLRRFILDLAVRGKLVKQDPSDEPVSTLLAIGTHLNARGGHQYLVIRRSRKQRRRRYVLSVWEEVIAPYTSEPSRSSEQTHSNFSGAIQNLFDWSR
jgi:hypothetical protein